METISFEDFKKLDIRIGVIVSAEKIEGTDKLLKLTVDLGDKDHRVVVAGIAKSHSPEDLRGKQIPMVVNLEPRKLRGVESQGMILAAVVDGKAVLLSPDNDVPQGTKVS